MILLNLPNHLLINLILNPNQMKTTLTITHQGEVRHLKSFQNGVIENTTDINEAKKFQSKAEATDFSKSNKGLLAWRATEHD